MCYRFGLDGKYLPFSEGVLIALMLTLQPTSDRWLGCCNAPLAVIDQEIVIGVFQWIEIGLADLMAVIRLWETEQTEFGNV